MLFSVCAVPQAAAVTPLAPESALDTVRIRFLLEALLKSLKRLKLSKHVASNKALASLGLLLNSPKAKERNLIQHAA